MNGEAPDTTVAIPRIQRHGEQNVGSLGRTIGLEFVVWPLLPVGIVEIDVEDLVAIRTEVDDARGSRIQQQRPQAPRQLEMTEVIDPRLRLKSVLRPLVRSEHHACVIDEDVDAGEPAADRYSGRTHARQTVQLQLDRLDRGGTRPAGDGFSRRPETLWVPAGEHNSGAC